jgi:hypothetical protein
LHGKSKSLLTGVSKKFEVITKECHLFTDELVGLQRAAILDITLLHI